MILVHCQVVTCNDFRQRLEQDVAHS